MPKSGVGVGSGVGCLSNKPGKLQAELVSSKMQLTHIMLKFFFMLYSLSGEARDAFFPRGGQNGVKRVINRDDA